MTSEICHSDAQSDICNVTEVCEFPVQETLKDLSQKGKLIDLKLDQEATQ